MQLFSQYIEPLTTWFYTHPQAALFITFLIAFMESLAIIGSIIPGSVTMTAIGILAGTGIIRVDLTLIAASLGAIAGDGVSYLLGYYFRERLASVWPFRHYPNLLAYGQLYFEKHGGKSVLIGRFVGPLRSIIPVIAGMLQMPKIRFFIANILSGIAWSFLYITPGILIGAASHELSPEKATRFVLLILLLLVSIWLLSIGIKSLFLRFRSWFEKYINQIWANWLQSPYLGLPIRMLTPVRERQHANTAILCMGLIMSLGMLALMTNIHFTQDQLLIFNQPMHFLLQSVRTHTFDLFFAVVHQFMTPPPIYGLFIYMGIVTLIWHDFKGLLLWISMVVLILCFIPLFQHFSPTDLMIKPSGILENKIDFPFPLTTTTLASTCFLMLFFHNRQSAHSFLRKAFSFLLLSSLLLGGLSLVYLGDLWLTDLLASLSMGISFGLIYWLVYRKTHPLLLSHSTWFPLMGCIVLLCTTTISSYLHLNQTLQNHQIYFTQHVFSPGFWWNQEKPILPIYSRNRLGRIVSVFNVQYVGNIGDLRRALEAKGWKKQTSSLFHTVLKQVEGKTHVENPLYGSVYLHRKPILTLIYQPKHAPMLIRLQLWRSNYYLHSFQQPIWLGHVQLINPSLNRPLFAQDPALTRLKRSLPTLQTKLFTLPASGPHPHSLIRANYILLIQP